MKNLILFLLVTLKFQSVGLVGQTNHDSVFSTSEIILTTSTGDIFGTLTIPHNLNGTPIVLIIPGSGPTDRDCNSPIGLQTNAYKMLSEGLATNGISSLRFDKRGIGKSQMAGTSESDK